MSQRTSASERFLADFSLLERELRRGVACPVERMIIELELTPGRVRQIEQNQGIKLPWFTATYSTMKRHRLLEESTSWEDWLSQYRARRLRAEMTAYL